eukprot:CAMPEP_0170567864 /NCGR_PEP_ID=MMETSP0211-20121228/80761_1 /TAXON_ID=311385 /ORGANISM="Pseudokeronopsis sp., Strain OXSARD2" /LENGTH=151 /DNA_ID=CAMNT_0010889453 /DNA_START=96 /DNA_END=551 /DNA_ORIENTATION=+
MRSHIPHQEMVVRASSDENFTLGDHIVLHGLGVEDDLLGILLEARGGDFLELDRQGGEFVEGGASHHLEFSIGSHFLLILESIEYQSMSGPSQALVGSGRDHVAMLEGGREHLGGNEATGVSHVMEERSPYGVRNLSEALVVEISGVPTGS